MQNPLFLVLTAPSGGGKSTLIRMLRAEFPRFAYSVSCTTRAPRGLEKDGEAYHFITTAQFEERIAAGLFLEHALVHGHRYGTLKSEVEGPLARGDWALLDIDVAGAAQVRSIVMREPEDSALRRGFLDVFIDVPSLDELRRRLVKRGEDSPETIETRLTNAEGEIARKGEFMEIVLNDKIDEAYARLRGLVLAKTGAEGRS